MDPIHREILDIHHHHLVTSLRASDVIDGLLKENAINKYDYDQLKRTEAQGARAMNRLLILTLRRRGGEAYPAFQRSLLDSDQKDLHDTLRNSELDLLEGLLTDRLKRSQEASLSRLGPSSVGINNLHHTFPDLDLDSDRSESPVPVLRKASSPALKTPHRKSNNRSPARRPGASSPSSKQQEADRDQQLKQLEEEVQDLRRSYGKMETELKQQIEQLGKEREDGKKKKEGGCAVM